MAHSSDWDKVWQQGSDGQRLVRGAKFDLGRAHQLLCKFVKDGKIPNGRALVPGCGRGYDVGLLASASRHVTGLDLSTTGIEEVLFFFYAGAADHESFAGAKLLVSRCA